MNGSPDKNENSPDPSSEVPLRERFLRLPWRGGTLLCMGLLFCSLGLSGVGRLLFDTESEFLNSVAGLFALAILPCFVLALLARARNCTADGPTQKRLVFWGGLLSIIGLSTAILTVIVPMVMQSAEEVAADALDREWVQQTFSEGKYAVAVPAAWEPTNGAQPLAGVLQLSDHRRDLHLLASASPKVDLSVSSLTELRERLIEPVVSELSQPTVERSDVIAVGNETGTDTVVTGSAEGTNLYIFFRHYDAGDDWVEIRVWSPPSQVEKHHEILERIVESLQAIQ